MSAFREAQDRLVELMAEHPDVDPRKLLDEFTQWPQDEWPKPTVAAPAHSVAIVGKGPYDVLAPWGQPGWEFWGLNDAPTSNGWPPIEAHTRWFQLHNPQYMRKHYPKGIDELARHWGGERGVILYMDRHYPEYPESVAYPKTQVEELLPYSFGRYHTSSFDWMVALAIHEGFTTIHLHGVEFGAFPYTAGEPISGRACLEFWMGVAAGRGVDIALGPQHMGDMFLTTHMARFRSTTQYGFEGEPALELGNGWTDVR